MNEDVRLKKNERIKINGKDTRERQTLLSKGDRADSKSYLTIEGNWKPHPQASARMR